MALLQSGAAETRSAKPLGLQAAHVGIAQRIELAKKSKALAMPEFKGEWRAQQELPHGKECRQLNNQMGMMFYDRLY